MSDHDYYERAKKLVVNGPYTVQQLTKMLGGDVGRIWRNESTPVRIDLAMLIAHLHGVSLHWLYTGATDHNEGGAPMSYLQWLTVNRIPGDRRRHLLAMREKLSHVPPEEVLAITGEQSAELLPDEIADSDRRVAMDYLVYRATGRDPVEGEL